MRVNIQDIKPGLIKGVEVQLPENTSTYKETYFNWTATPLVGEFKTCEVSGGVLRAWHHVPAFKEVETHIDDEMFYFLSGNAIMLFMDVNDGKPDMESAQICRIRPGTQIVISAGKAHFVAVAEDSEPVLAVVVAPKMDAPRMPLPETVEGI